MESALHIKKLKFFTVQSLSQRCHYRVGGFNKVFGTELSVLSERLNDPIHLGNKCNVREIEVGSGDAKSQSC